MNIAERCASYYEHEDFIDHYAMHLLEDQDGCIDRVKEAAYWYTRNGKYLHLKPTYRQCQNFIEHLRHNPECYEIDTFTAYYVGDTCIDSISFGQQAEDLQSLINNRTGKPYNDRYLIRVFEDAGYTINKRYGLTAYYSLEGHGVKIDLQNVSPEIVDRYLG